MSGVAVNQNSNFDTKVFNLTESIANNGFSPNMTAAMGTWGQEIQKSVGLRITGGLAGPSITSPTVQVAFVDVAGANAGASFVDSYKNAVMARGDKYLYPLQQIFAHGVSDFQQLSIQRSQGANVDVEWADRMLKAPPINHWHVFSSLLWDNGMGIQGVGDGLFAIGGTVIQLLNKDSAHRFHRFQRIGFADPAQTVVRGQLVTLRALAALQDFPQIVGIAREAGQLTVDVAVSTAIPTADNADWIMPSTFAQATVDGNPELAYNEPTKGLFTITPLTDAEIAQPVFSVDQTVDQEARAGIRADIDATATVESVISKLARLLNLLPHDAMSEINGTLYFPATLAEDVMDAFFRSTITMSPIVRRVNDPSLFMLGVSRWAAEFPTGHRLALVSDKMLSNPFVTRENDKTYVVVLNDSWSVRTLDGFGFLQDGAPVAGRGVLRQVVGNQQAVAASFGSRHVMAPFGGAGKVLLLSNNKALTPFTF